VYAIVEPISLISYTQKLLWAAAGNILYGATEPSKTCQHTAIERDRR